MPPMHNHTNLIPDTLRTKCLEVISKIGEWRPSPLRDESLG